MLPDKPAKKGAREHGGPLTSEGDVMICRGLADWNLWPLTQIRYRLGQGLEDKLTTNCLSRGAYKWLMAEMVIVLMTTGEGSRRESYVLYGRRL